MFIGANVRKATNEGRADYVPVFLSETPLLFRRGIIPLDVAIVQVVYPASCGSFVSGVGKTQVDDARDIVGEARGMSLPSLGPADEEMVVRIFWKLCCLEVFPGLGFQGYAEVLLVANGM